MTYVEVSEGSPIVVEVTPQQPSVYVEVTEGPIPAAGGGSTALPWLLDRAYWYPGAAAGVKVNSPTSGPLLDQLRASPMYVPAACTVEQLGIRTVQSVAGALARYGIYADAGGQPGALVWQSAVVDIGFTGFAAVFPSPAIALEAGWYWPAYVGQGAASPAMHLFGGLVDSTTDAYGMIAGLGTHNQSTVQNPSHYYQLLAPSQPLPDPWGPSLQAGGDGMPAFWLQVAPP